MRLLARHNAGLTLIEVLITLSLLSLAIGLIAGLAGQYLRLTGAGSQRSQAELAVQALRAVSEEVTGAVNLTLPPPSGQVSEELVFLKLDPARDRFAPPEPPVFLPLDSSFLLRVRYGLQGGRLVREVQDLPTVAVQDGVVGFSAKRIGKRELELSLSFQEGQGWQTVRSRVYCWWER